MSITLRNVFKSYDNKKYAAKDVSFVVDDNDFVVILGPSGCGKSTILNMICGLEKITSGELLFEDTVFNEVPVQKRNVAMVFQNYALYPHMNVYSNIAFPMKNRKESKEFIDSEVHRIADILGT